MKSLKVIIYLFILFSLPTIISAQNGSLDPTFGDSGIVELDGNYSKIIQHKLVDENKSMLLVESNIDSYLIKINNSDGSVDESFGLSGKLNLNQFLEISDTTTYFAKDFSFLSDGEIIISFVRRGSQTILLNLYVVKLSSNGELITEFAESGLFIKPIIYDGTLSNIIDGTGKIAVSNENKIIATIISGTEGDLKASLLQLNSDGTIDFNFGNYGIYEYQGQSFARNTLAIDGAGNIFYGDDGWIVKINSNGILDTNFGESGYFFYNYHYYQDIDFQSDGKIIATANYWGIDQSRTPDIIRINLNGTIDTTFGDNGVKSLFLGETDFINKLNNTIVLTNNNIITGGYLLTDTLLNNPITLIKLDENGEFKPCFGEDGKVVLNLYEDTEELTTSLIVNPIDSKITVSLIRKISDTESKLILARFTNSLSCGSEHYSGVVYGDWSNIDTAYVDGDITIPLGKTLTINEGVNVFFTGKYKVDVNGQLIAKGTQEYPITFSSPTEAPWRGINFLRTDDNYQPNSKLDYCEFTNSKAYWNDGLGPYWGVLNFNHSKVYVDNSFFHHTTGIYSNNSSSELVNTDFLTVSPMWIDSSSTVLISYCNFDSSGVIIYNSSPIINNCIIEHSSNGSGTRGIFGYNANPNISFTIIKNNSTTMNGAGVYFENSSPIFDHVTFENNSATYSANGGYGGGGYFSKSFPTFTNVIVKENTASSEGAGFLFSSVNSEPTLYTATFNNCLIVKNTVTNTNSGSGAGAEFWGNTNGEFTNCTIADNFAHSWAGINGDGGEDSHLNNCIVYNNGNDLDFQAGGLYTYSIVQGNYVGSDTATTNFQNVDPLFRDAANADYHLQSIDCGFNSNSPAIDAGNPNISDFLYDCETAGLGSTLSDIGAYGGADNRWDHSVIPSCYYRGEVSGVWDCEYITIIGDILVPAGETLEITQNVQRVVFTGPYQIKVEGQLIANGPDDAEVGLNGEQLLFSGYSWHGIFFKNTNGQGTSIINNCRFDNANKMDITYQGGGAINIYNSDSVIVKGSVFYNNKAKFGGAMYIENSNPVIDNCYFENNGHYTNSVQTEAGGAIFIKNSNPKLHKIKFIGNTSYSGGGAIVFDNSSPEVSNILAVKNTTNGLGGAFHLVSGASPKFVNITSADNIAEIAGGAFYLNPNSNPTIINSIFYDDTKPEIYLGDGTPTITYSLIDSAKTESYFGEGCLDENPRFEMTIGNFYYLASTNCGDVYNSIAVDAGHPDSLDAFSSCEQGRGTTRADMGFYGGRYSDFPVGIQDEIASTPTKYALQQNYPNPFNPSTTIQFAIPKAGMVDLKVYNILGEEVATLVNENQKSGNYEVKFNASKLASGIYLYKLQSGSFIQTRKLMLLK